MSWFARICGRIEIEQNQTVIQPATPNKSQNSLSNRGSRVADLGQRVLSAQPPQFQAASSLPGVVNVVDRESPISVRISVVQNYLTSLNELSSDSYQNLSDALAKVKELGARNFELEKRCADAENARVALGNEHKHSQQVADTIIHDSAGLAHNISLALDTLLAETEKLSEASQESLEAIRCNSKALNKLLKKKLLMSKILAGKVGLESVPFSVVEFLKSIYHQFNPRMKAKNLEFKLDIDKTVPLHLIGDPDGLNQILSNLLANAAKFTEKGSITLKIELVERTLDNAVLVNFSVNDTGIGIPEKEQQTLGVPFQQAESSGRKKSEGTGLGLTISKSFIKLMQKPGVSVGENHLQIRSRVGQGSTFSFNAFFPIAQAMKTVVETKYVPLTRLSILCVDDDKVCGKLMKQMLKKMGCANVTIAASGEEALAIVEKNIADKKTPFDAVFVDINLPGINGYETAWKITALTIAEGLPLPYLIGCSGNAIGLNQPSQTPSVSPKASSRPIPKAILNYQLMKPVSRDAFYDLLHPLEEAKDIEPELEELL